MEDRDDLTGDTLLLLAIALPPRDALAIIRDTDQQHATLCICHYCQSLQAVIAPGFLHSIISDSGWMSSASMFVIRLRPLHSPGKSPLEFNCRIVVTAQHLLRFKEHPRFAAKCWIL
jgi:hypothetical protein